MLRILYLKIFFLILIFFSTNLLSEEIWILDKNLSTINFELPILLINNVKGEFKSIEGVIEIDTDTKKNNKAVFSVNLNNIKMNYKKYKPLLLSEIFLNVNKFPVALIDTKKFSYINESLLNLDVELSIKGITKNVPLEVKINVLSEGLVQIKGKLIFSRTLFHIGMGSWSSTKILKDKTIIHANLFLFKQ